jgi:hypothetical protein
VRYKLIFTFGFFKIQYKAFYVNPKVYSLSQIHCNHLIAGKEKLTGVVQENLIQNIFEVNVVFFYCRNRKRFGRNW